MSRALGAELPLDLLERLSGRDLPSVQTKVIQACTVDAHGWPHLALLSYLEVVATDVRHIRCATYATSTTSSNLRHSGRVTFAIIDERVAYYVKAKAIEIATALQTTAWNAAFECRVEQVSVDAVDEEHEPGAYLMSGVTYYNPRRSSELAGGHALLTELASLVAPPRDS